ncbi:uncharacterized protein [Linepithema humile]|nr:PREDICTED: uncharacterized protein LOC105671141 [Linepithema humile]XP_012220495.1 PREDICTED: uncharacterized protein LOC105671141 [Linepithema humile]
MELYKRMPVYKDAGYLGDVCSNCGRNEYEDVTRGIGMRKRRTKNYEKHCPSCHCPPERQRFSPLGRPKTSENVEAVLNRYERVSAEPISSAIKKSQSSPLSQKVCWHDCHANVHSRCPKRSLQARRQRRIEHDKYLFRMKGDTVNSELIANEDVEACTKYTQSIPIKSSLRHSHCREPEASPDEQEYSDAESEVSMKYTPRERQSRKLRVPNPGSRRHYGDGEHIAELRNESDDVRERNARECEEMRRFVLGLEDFERLKRGDGEAATTISEDEKRIERRKLHVAKAMKQKRSAGDAAPYGTISKPSALIKESISKPQELVLEGPACLTKLDLNTTKSRILESIDHMLGTMDDTRNNAPVQQEQTEQETIEKITRELQENGWQLLFNALTIHRDSTDSSRRTVRLECLNHIRQQLDKLYALESTLDNCPLKLQSLSSHDVPCSEERQPLEQKIADS